MSLLLSMTFLLTLGYINSMSLPVQLQKQFETDLLMYNNDILDNVFNDAQNYNKIMLAKTNDDELKIGKTGRTMRKRNENKKYNKNDWDIQESTENYPSTYDDCEKKRLLDYKLYDDDYENLMQKYKVMEQLLLSLGAANVVEAFTNSGLNSSGRREGPLYADEPKYIVIPKEDEDELINLNGFKDFFIPPRGRKQMPILEKIKNHYELFVPNRGKKATTIKKDKIKDIFKYNDLFFPNRGKKNIDIEKLEI